MSDDVNIKISATDNATAVLQSVQSALKGFNKTVQSVAGFNLAGIGPQQIGAFLSDSLKAYGESERSVAMLDRVLKSTGNTIKMTRKEIQDYAELRKQQTAFDDDAIVEAASQLARFRDLSGDTFTATLDAAQDLATVMGTDLVSATQMLGRAMSDPADGMAKLARAGVLFTDSQKEQIKTLDAIGDRAGQQRIILEELQRQFGGAAAADASTASGQIKQLSNAIDDLKKAIGAELLPALQSFLSVVRGSPKAIAADILLSNDKIGSISEESRRLDSLRKARADLVAEQERNRQIVADIAQNPIRSAFSPFRNAAAIEGLAGSNQRIDAIDKALQDQGARIVQALQTAIAAVPVDVVKGAVSRVFADMASAATGATSSAFASRMAAVNAGDAGGALGQQVRGMFFGQNWWNKQQQQQDRALQATESRFLTRGRGQLSPAEQKNLEEQKKQTALLARIERDLNELPSGMMLVVQGVN